MNLNTTIVSLAAIGTMVGGVWAIDARYALAGDMRSLADAITKTQEMLTKDRMTEKDESDESEEKAVKVKKAAQKTSTKKPAAKKSPTKKS